MFHWADEAASVQVSQPSILKTFIPGMVTLSIRCTKVNAMKDEHMDVNPCINIMAQWFQAE